MGNLHYHSHQLKKNMSSMKWAGRLTLNKDNLTKLEITGSLKLNW